MLVVIQAVCDMLTPYFLYNLLEFLQDEEAEELTRGYLLIGGMMGSQWLMFMFSEHFWVYTVGKWLKLGFPREKEQTSVAGHD